MFLHAAAFYIYQCNFTSINLIFSAIIHFLMEIDSCITIHEAEMEIIFFMSGGRGGG
jgi:hypothetical protein